MITKVVTVSNRIPTESYYHYSLFMRSLSRFGVIPEVLGIGHLWQGLMTKPNHFRQWLRETKFQEGERVILTDCWDVVFADHPDNVAQRCKQHYGDAVVFNTEKSCWPLAELAHYFPDVGSPWRFLNGGVICGPADKLLAMFEAMKLEEYGFDRTLPDGTKIEPNDAVPLVKAYVEQPVPVVVDQHCRVFQCFSEWNESEFEISDKGVRNVVTNTRPGVLHFNGGSKDRLLPVVANAMGL